jgi:hypothetical protein
VFKPMARAWFSSKQNSIRSLRRISSPTSVIATMISVWMMSLLGIPSTLPNRMCVRSTVLGVREIITKPSANKPVKTMA